MADVDESPSWLADTPAPTATPTPPAHAAPSTSSAVLNNNASSTLAPRPTPAPNAEGLASSNTLTEEEEDAKLKAAIMFLRLMNLGVAATMMTHAILAVVSFPPIGQFILAFYAICASCLICCLETQLKFVRTPIAMNFGFLFDPSLRFLFYVIMASLEWSFGNLFGKIVAGVILGAAVYNAFVMWKYPKYRKQRDALAKLEDERIQNKIRGRIANEAGRQVRNAVWDPNASS